MAEILYVKEEHFAVARAIEDKLLSSSDDSGILFVGVTVSPTTVEEEPDYNVWVGCSRDMPEKTIGYAVYFLLREEIAHGVNIKDVEVHRGAVRG
jgi:hypothetical protein